MPSAPSSAVSLATCVQPEARSPAVSRVNTYADPAVGSLVVVPIRPDHHRVAVDRRRWSRMSCAAPSSAVSLATCVQPEARSPAVSRVNTYADPCSLCRPYAPITTVSPSIDTLEPNSSLVSAVVRGQLGNLRPAGGEVAGCVAREHVRGPLWSICRHHTPRSPSCRRRSRR